MASFRDPYSEPAFGPAFAYFPVIVVEDASDTLPFSVDQSCPAVSVGPAAAAAGQAVAAGPVEELGVASAAAFVDTCLTASGPCAAAFVPFAGVAFGRRRQGRQPSHWDWEMGEDLKATARIQGYIPGGYFACIDLVVVCHAQKVSGTLVSQ